MAGNDRRLPGYLLGAAVAALSLTGLPRPTWAQTPPAPTAQEQAAIDVVKEWFAAWQDGDADRMASYMADEVEFRGIPTQPLRSGKDAFLKNTGRFIKLKPQVEVTEAVAIGGATGVAVLTKRIDTIALNGPPRKVPLAAFFRVRDGKIVEWLDIPLVALGALPAAPGGATRANP